VVRARPPQKSARRALAYGAGPPIFLHQVYLAYPAPWFGSGHETANIVQHQANPNQTWRDMRGRQWAPPDRGKKTERWIPFLACGHGRGRAARAGSGKNGKRAVVAGPKNRSPARIPGEGRRAFTGHAGTALRKPLGTPVSAPFRNRSRRGQRWGYALAEAAIAAERGKLKRFDLRDRWVCSRLRGRGTHGSGAQTAWRCDKAVFPTKSGAGLVVV